MSNMAKLEVRHLTISFRTNNGAVRAVRDISFDLNEGETLAIAGESGSGKSVTTRAVMGILAGNAMVESGEIIYDGKDLLKIPEEDFHTLRGHKLSMVFQDPLSALNPIMRIGKQLTEAMILNNKERRRDGRDRFNSMLQLLEKTIVAAREKEGEPGDVKAQTQAKCQTFNSFVDTGVKLDFAYQAATEAAVEARDCCEEMLQELPRKEYKRVRELSGQLQKAIKGVNNDFVIPADDQAFAALAAEVVSLSHGCTAHQADALQEKATRLSQLLQEATQKDAPNFFCIGYVIHKGGTVDPRKESVEKINQDARAALDEGFMNDFLQDVRKAIRYSEQCANEEKRTAIAALEKELPVFQEKNLDEGRCKAAANRAAAAVEKAIDRLALEKDSQSYVFKSSMMAYIDRYFKSLTHNPKEEKRFKKDTAKFEALRAKGKMAAAVVPMNLIDTENARQNLILTVTRLIDHFKEQLASQTEADDEQQAVDMIDYLKARSSEYAYRLTEGMARHRAIELMKEVGIPEPAKRFHQYPFEFSGGMRQRIVIAIALSANPDILICDEPTTALDVTIQAQILELINRLKKERKLSVIFITHDLGVVANMADRIAIMYAGKIVEYGTADDVFYDPRHPYTWALLSSMPDLETKEKLEAIPGTPPNMILPPKGDAFAARNKYAMQIDFEEQPPMFRVSDTHTAATWLMHPNAPKVEPPAIVRERIERMKRRQTQSTNEGGKVS